MPNIMVANICILINLRFKPQQMGDLDLLLHLFLLHSHFYSSCYYYCYYLFYSFSLKLNGLLSFSFRFSFPTFSYYALCFWVSSISISTTQKFSSLVALAKIPPPLLSSSSCAFSCSCWCRPLVFDFVAVSVTVSHQFTAF